MEEVLPGTESSAQASLSRAESCGDGRESTRARILGAAQARVLRQHCPEAPRSPEPTAAPPTADLLRVEEWLAASSALTAFGEKLPGFAEALTEGFGSLRRSAALMSDQAAKLQEVSFRFHSDIAARDVVCSPRLRTWASAEWGVLSLADS